MKTVLRFFDDFWLDVRKNVKRSWYQPVLAGQLGKYGVYPSASWCPEAGVYRLWYEVMPDFARDKRRFLALAESADGVDWHDVAAASGGLPPDARAYGNVVLAGGPEGIHGTGVLRDPWDPDPARRYKLCTMGAPVSYAPRSKKERNMVLCCSPDGVGWDWDHARTIYPFKSDTYNCILYNPVLGEYQLLFRASNLDRRVAAIRSADTLSWSRPMTVIHPDAEYRDDSEMIQLYALWAGWFDGMFLGTLWRFHTDAADESCPKMSGSMDTELVYSYNGINWMHTTRGPVVPRPQPPAFGHAQLCITGMFETKDRESWVLVATGSRAIHGNSKEQKRLQGLQGMTDDVCFYRIRRDGLCGLECCGRGGLIGTKPFDLLEGDLSFNINAPFGQVRFAVTGPEAKPYEGFSFDDCLPFTGDERDLIPAWKGHDLKELKGRRVRIWAELATAVLHSMTATVRPNLYGPQVSVSDPTRVEMAEGLTDPPCVLRRPAPARSL